MSGYIDLYWEKNDSGHWYGSMKVNDNLIVVDGKSGSAMKEEAIKVLDEMEGIKNPKFYIKPITMLKN